MRKSEAVDFFGGEIHLAVAMELTEAAIRAWPPFLDKRRSAQVIGIALENKGPRKTKKAFPTYFQEPAS